MMKLFAVIVVIVFCSIECNAVLQIKDIETNGNVQVAVTNSAPIETEQDFKNYATAIWAYLNVHYPHREGHEQRYPTANQYFSTGNKVTISGNQKAVTDTFKKTFTPNLSKKGGDFNTIKLRGELDHYRDRKTLITPETPQKYGLYGYVNLPQDAKDPPQINFKWALLGSQMPGFHAVTGSCTDPPPPPQQPAIHELHPLLSVQSDVDQPNVFAEINDGDLPPMAPVLMMRRAHREYRNVYSFAHVNKQNKAQNSYIPQIDGYDYSQSYSTSSSVNYMYSFAIMALTALSFCICCLLCMGINIGVAVGAYLFGKSMAKRNKLHAIVSHEEV